MPRATLLLNSSCVAKLLKLLLMVLIWAPGSIVISAEEEEKTDSHRDLSLEALLNLELSTINKNLVRFTNAPAALTIVTRADIRAFGWRDLSEVINAQIGFNVFTDRTYHFITSRGYYQANDPNSRVLLLINGHSVVEFFGYFNGHLPSLELSQLERIEIVRGPQSASYGTNAMFAVINLVTLPYPHDGFVELEAGSHEQQKITLARAKTSRYGAHWQGHITYEKGDRQSLYFEEYDQPGLSSGHSPAAANQEESLKLSMEVITGEWRIQGFLFRRQKHVPVGLFGGAFQQDDTFFRDQNAFIEAKYERETRAGSAGFRIWWDTYSFDGRFIYEPDENGETGPPYREERTHIHGQSVGAEMLLKLNSALGRTTLGLEWKQYHKINFRYQSVDHPALDEVVNENPHEDILSVYVAQRFKINKIDLQAGLHYDHYESVGDQFSLRTSAVYNTGDRDKFKLIYGEAFRAPNYWELRGGFSLMGNQDLKPETLDYGEFIWEHQFNRHFFARGSLFSYRLKDTIRVADNNQFENRSMLEADGCELLLTYQTPTQKAWAGVDWSDAELDEDRVEFTANWSVKAGFKTPLFSESTTFAAEGRVQGPRLLDNREAGKLPATYLCDANFIWTPGNSSWDLSLRIRNLFNHGYEDPAFESDSASGYRNLLYPVYDIPADGRNFSMRLTRRW